MLNGYKTWLGIVITIVGMTGISKFVTSYQLNEIVDLVAKLIGIGIAIYGNWDAHKRLKEANK